MTVRRARIVGCGSYLPERQVTNDELALTIDTSDEWIVQRTGIKSRHIAAEDELTSDMALAASRPALAQAGIDPADLDLIVLATTTPDHTFPATAVRVQAELGMANGMAFDVQAVCSGFVYALAVANNFVITGQAKTALVIGAEAFSRILDWEDRGTCVLFGDGAGAVVLQAGEGQGTSDDHGVLSTHLHSDGRYQEMLYVDGGVGASGTIGHVRMHGREVFKFAVNKLAEVVDEALEANGLTAKDVRWLVPHQANRRIIDAMARKLDLPPDRV
ncbi:MAG: beta-ketoacyl-ACP synthase III, partial [Pseudomonadota bacterium]